MTNDQILLEIMEKTINTLQSNKNAVISIIKNLQNEHEKKKKELMAIKEQLPKTFIYVKQLTTLDQKLRQQLANASNDFSSKGHEYMNILFQKASTVHIQLLDAQETEKSAIRRRDELELDLKHSQFNIDQAECMAQQLFISLSYLQTSINQLHTASEETAHSEYLTFFRCLENEKLRIARDLHDGPAQHIASVQMKVDFCKTIIAQDLDKGIVILDQLKSNLSEALSEIRDILFDLNPAPLEKLGLKQSIENMLCSVLDPTKMHVAFSYELESLTLSATLQATLYRLIQELITNIKKHAKATHVTLRLYEVNHFIYIYLEDNGIGFDVPSDLEVFRTMHRSFGLVNLTTRISELKGSFKINSTKDKGSTFRIQLPIRSI